MAGHNKWSKIKHKKAKEDSKRGKAFTKLIKEITVVARAGGGDPSGNARLRTLLEQAKAINMPQENAIRAVKKGTGELPGVSYEEHTYEGYGPYGIAVIIESLTDNKNRTVAALRHIFSKHGGNLAETGSVSWMFEPKGVIRLKTDRTEDELLELLLDFDISDLQYDDDDMFTVICNPKEIDKIKKSIEEETVTIESADIERIAQNNVDLPEDQAHEAYDFLNLLEENDDVQNVYTNLA
ncbi:YebC/PmpR family DNA-binding transcriptional regulator [Candidatus Dependentiae bacterium]|nr:YebC/PmpR family DNA-binding transcriptional regulator [Candidatus Dependentiae bacterium]